MGVLTAGSATERLCDILINESMEPKITYMRFSEKKPVEILFDWFLLYRLKEAVANEENDMPKSRVRTASF